MKIGRGSKRLSLGLLTAVALLALGALFVGGASATYSDASGLPANQGPFDPLESNVPYLAWTGEEVRLVKCLPHDPFSNPFGNPVDTSTGFSYHDSNNLDINMQIFAYSGPQENTFDGPKPVTGTASVFYDYANDRICMRQTWISNKPGITQFKLTMAYNGITLMQHDFMVGWMDINSAAITNPGSVTELPGTTPGNSVNVQVRGSIPLNSQFQANYGLPATLVMPNDWAMWAHAMATTDGNLSGYPGDPPASAYWDIHGSSAPAALGVADTPDQHVNTNLCGGTLATDGVDQVDNCTGSMWFYSRVFGDLGSGVGPFDPAFASTLLSDGRLNAADAPMPAAKIVFNSSGGMGGFVDGVMNTKACVYNRNSDVANGNCVAAGHSPTEAHALYAPYYYQYIPATSRGYGSPYDASSGVDGPVLDTNNFQGFQWYGKYQNWQIAQTAVQNEPANSGCLLTGKTYRLTNDGATQVIEYTDEHGEARAQWQPGWNADFFATAFVDQNGGCDLQGVTFPNQTITASARYPFQPVANDVQASGSITKVIQNLFAKSVSCVRKDNTSNAIAYICTASAQDIAGNGNVFNGEKVCFSREPTGVWYTVGGNIPVDGTICSWLSGGTATAPATASVETLATLQGTQLDISANFTGENLLRDACVVVGSASSTDGPCGATGGGGGTTTSGSTGGTTTSGSTGGTTTSGTTTSGSTGGNAAVVTYGKINKATHTARLAKVQLVLARHGRVLFVKVLSAKKMAKIHVVLVNSKHHVIKRVVRTVKTNKRVKVTHLRIGKQVKHVRVSLVR
jgi:hypothetical protein